MSEPVRWREPGSQPPPGARDVLAEMSGPPPMSSMVRARVGQRVSDLAREAPPARTSPSMWLAAAMVGAACAGAFALVHVARRPDHEPPIAARAAPSQKTAPAQAMPPPEPQAHDEARDERVEERTERIVERTERVEERTERVEERTERVEERTERTERRPRAERRIERDGAEPPPRRRVVDVPAPAPDPEPGPIAATEHGLLSINTSPWARVFVDGEPVGLTPVLRHRLEPGVHDVRLEASDGTVSHMRVFVRPGQHVRMNHRGGSISAQMDVTFP